MVLSMDNATTKADRNISLTNRQENLKWRVTIRPMEWRSWWVLRGLAWALRILIHGNILCITHKTPNTHPYLPHMERHSKFLKTLILDLPHKGKIPILKGSWFATRHYISTRPLFSQVRRKSLTFSLQSS